MPGYAQQRIRAHTAEAVRLGHPDKVADRISDACLDATLRQDSTACAAIETLIAGQNVVVAGEVPLGAELDIEGIVRQVMQDTLYTRDAYAETEWRIQDLTQVQSDQIRSAVLDGPRRGAGDQGIIYGYACQGPQNLPLPRVMANAITKRLDGLQAKWSWLRPDGKAQVTLKGGHVDAVVSTSHAQDQPVETIRDAVLHGVLLPVADTYEVALESVSINPAGAFSKYGPLADTGLTGRKTQVDAYGTLAPHGGGAWSGKDPTKVDRSAAYWARHVAKNILHAHNLEEVTLAVAYAIGKPGPVSVEAELRSSSVRAHKPSLLGVLDGIDCSVDNMIDRLDLQRPIYEDATVKGHLGDSSLPWEALA